jgi:hypothetical protein
MECTNQLRSEMRIAQRVEFITYALPEFLNFFVLLLELPISIFAGNAPRCSSNKLILVNLR